MEADSVASKPVLKNFFSPKTVISRFVTRRTVLGSMLWALVFGLVFTIKSTGYAKAYPTAIARDKLAESFSSNIGLSALLGLPKHINTVTGFAVWNTLGIFVIIGAIWGLLTATKKLRGEEEVGRWEMLLAGQTTSLRANANALVGFGVSLSAMYVVLAVIVTSVGRTSSVNFSTSAGLFFALVAVSGAALFMSIGALTSQLMPTKARAASITSIILGVFFLIRAMADTTSAHWLLNLTPLGWIEKAQPIYGSQPLWLAPIGVLVILCCSFSVLLAGRRDLGESIVADKVSSRPHIKLLNGPLSMALRLTRGANIAWLIAITLASLFFGLLAKSAATALSQSTTIEKRISSLTHASQSIRAVVFLGIVFFLLMTLLMCYTASSAGAIRNDEADGYLDNLLVRKVSRLQWLGGRILLTTSVIIVAGLLVTVTNWLTASSQHLGISFHSLLLSGINTIVPSILILGIGIFSIGVVPRLTTVLAYGLIAWSFLLDILSSGININHWILDTSIFTHMASSPAQNPNWTSASVIVALSLVLMIIGSAVFNARDLQAE